MKNKFTLFIFIALLVFNAKAQNSTPNGDFELWTTFSYEDPLNYFTNNAEAKEDGIPFTCTKSVDPYQGSYALKLTTQTGGMSALSGNYQPNNAPPWHGGFPYSEMPTGFTGYYKSDIQDGDSAIIVVNFSKDAVNTGVFYTKIFGTHSVYTPFTIPISLAQAPDSVIIFFISSDALNDISKEGSTITVDNISFTGVASQPLLLNGGFEQWQTIESKSLDKWYLEGYNPNMPYQTTDRFEGNFAVELETYLGERNGKPRANGQKISTGYWDQNCNCNKGGYPYSQTKDTLAFWYKYSPSGKDTAQVGIQFKKNKMSYSYAGQYLLASPSYQYVEIPFDLFMAPDTAVIEFVSSLWSDSLVSYVGSNLKVDDVHFKSQRTPVTGIFSKTISSTVSVFPNPGSGVFTFSSESNMTCIQIYSANGVNVSALNPNFQRRVDVDLSKQPKGFYFYRVNGTDGVARTGKLIIN